MGAGAFCWGSSASVALAGDVRVVMIAWDETERRANPGRFTGEEVLLLFSGDMLIEILDRGAQGTDLLAAPKPVVEESLIDL